jgi:cation:H+ antiporter
VTLILFFGGLAFLIIGAESLVRGASRLAAAVGISPLVLGLTVVAYGTSAPELAVSVQSSLSGRAAIALGNVVGSNIFNVLFILGISALIMPLAVSHQLVRLDVPLMVGVSVLTLILAVDGRFGRFDGVLLFSGLVIYTIFSIRQSRRESTHQQAGQSAGFVVVTSCLFAVLIGLVLLVLGSRWLVTGAVAIAKLFGLSELAIGLTVVAAGTSLPEVATSIIASIRGERDIAVGNVVGSNIFNILAVLGLSSIVAPNGVSVSSSALHFDIPVMIAVAFACLPIFFTGHVIARWEGLLFFGYYLAYTLYLILATIQHGTLPVFSHIMMVFVLPLTAVTLLVLGVRGIQSRRLRS